MKKFAYFIATEKGYRALEYTINIKRQYIGCVITFKEVNVKYDWSSDIINLCNINGIPVYLWKDVKNSLFELFKEYSITNAVTIAWRYLLPMKLNEYLQDGLIVFHDSLLPKYRGFAPTPTAIICGENVIGVTAIFASDKVDEGDIIMQRQITIDDDMYIDQIIEAQALLCAKMLSEIIDLSLCGRLQATPQNNDDATYSIWRNTEDCRIDWNRSSVNIYNFIRALGAPLSRCIHIYVRPKDNHKKGQKIIL